MDYQPQEGENPIQDWYDEQDDDIRAEFEVALIVLSSDGGWSDVTDCVPLTGKYLGLYELVIDVSLQDEVREIRPIGLWRPDSRDFIILACCEKTGEDYNPPLEEALDYKAAWEQGKGEIHEHKF